MQEKNNDRIHIAYTIDLNFINCAAASIASVLQSNPNRCHIHIIHDGDIDAGLTKLQQMIKSRRGLCSVHLVPNSFPRKLFTDKHATIANYYRLAIPDILPTTINRAIYLDADTLVRRPLDALFEINLGASTFAAVAEPNPEACTRLGLGDGTPYLNSGVLVIDLDAWRKDELGEQLLKLASESGNKWEYWDQDVIACHFKGQWKRLPPEYNLNHRFIFSGSDSFLPTLNPFIVHFSGNKLKPWQSNLYHPFGDEFWAVAEAIKKDGFIVKRRPKRLADFLNLKKIRAERKKRRKHAEKLLRTQVLSNFERDFVSSKLPSMTVIRGPFKGLKYPSAYAHGSSLIPKLLGTYEAELHESVFELAKKDYPLIINIGAAEGYYAVGAAQLWPKAIVLAFELVDSARDAITEMAKINGVENRIEVNAECMFTDLQGRRGLIICDIEGAEESSILGDNRSEKLSQCDLIIEAHDFVSAGITNRLATLFKDTHDVRIIESVNDSDRPAIWGSEIIEGISKADQEKALAERRPTVMHWLICESRMPFPLLPPNKESI